MEYCANVSEITKKGLHTVPTAVRAQLRDTYIHVNDRQRLDI